jgi:hypothetical protein
MNEMVEKVALAIWRVREEQFPERVRRLAPDGIDHATGAWTLIENFARAAIEAMREPTEAMIANDDLPYSPGEMLGYWHTMIDEALQ